MIEEIKKIVSSLQEKKEKKEYKTLIKNIATNPKIISIKKRSQ